MATLICVGGIIVVLVAVGLWLKNEPTYKWVTLGAFGFIFAIGGCAATLLPTKDRPDTSKEARICIANGGYWSGTTCTGATR